MKKYFIKTTAVLLMSAIFFMAGGFCFSSLLNLTIKMNFVQAASYDNKTVSNYDSCGEEHIDHQVEKKVSEPVMPAQTSNHHNSILPCCSDGGHPVFNTFSSSFEISKLIPVIFFSENQIFKTVFQTVNYNTPIIPPPELLALKSTILRI